MDRIIISRTDSIGDVILTLPLCVWLKKQFPQTELIFLGQILYKRHHCLF
jgi:ADP-heptose:LPS heptosyltransferase